MNKRITAVISSVFNSFCDFTLDIAVNKYDMYKILLYTSIISLFFQIIYAFYAGISITLESVPIILLYGLIVLLAYMFYVNSLKNIPIGLGALLENSDLFLILTIDIIVGNIIITPKFVFLFLLFIISVVWFTLETNKIKDEIKLKKNKIHRYSFNIIISFILCN